MVSKVSDNSCHRFRSSNTRHFFFKLDIRDILVGLFRPFTSSLKSRATDFTKYGIFVRSRQLTASPRCAAELNFVLKTQSQTAKFSIISCNWSVRRLKASPTPPCGIFNFIFSGMRGLRIQIVLLLSCCCCLVTVSKGEQR